MSIHYTLYIFPAIKVIIVNQHHYRLHLLYLHKMPVGVWNVNSLRTQELKKGLLWFAISYTM